MPDSLLGVPMPPLPSQPASVPWPTTEWPESAPDDSVDRASLDRVYETLFRSGDAERLGTTHALLCIHRGRLVAEAYGPEHYRDSTLISWSAAKSITHALVGILLRDGRLDLHGPAPVPAWRGRKDPRSVITTEQLLRMVDGLDFTEVYAGRTDVIDMLFKTGRDDVAAYAEARPLAHEPGTYWNYSSGTTNIVSAILGREVDGGEQGMRAFMGHELFDRIGMQSAAPRFDAAGTFIGSSYVFATARDFARFGLLYLRDGVWEDGRILPEGWVDHARSLTLPSFDQYGAHWWLARDGSGIFHASGYAGQYIVVVPTRDLVVVRLGDTPQDIRHHVVHLIRDLVEAFPLLG